MDSTVIVPVSDDHPAPAADTFAPRLDAIAAHFRVTNHCCFAAFTHVEAAQTSNVQIVSRAAPPLSIGRLLSTRRLEKLSNRLVHVMMAIHCPAAIHLLRQAPHSPESLAADTSMVMSVVPWMRHSASESLSAFKSLSAFRRYAGNSRATYHSMYLATAEYISELEEQTFQLTTFSPSSARPLERLRSHLQWVFIPNTQLTILDADDYDYDYYYSRRVRVPTI